MNLWDRDLELRGVFVAGEGEDVADVVGSQRPRQLLRAQRLQPAFPARVNGAGSFNQWRRLPWLSSVSKKTRKRKRRTRRRRKSILIMVRIVFRWRLRGSVRSDLLELQTCRDERTTDSEISAENPGGPYPKHTVTQANTEKQKERKQNGGPLEAEAVGGAEELVCHLLQSLRRDLIRVDEPQQLAEIVRVHVWSESL